LREALDAYDRGDIAHAEPLLRVLAGRYPRSYEANEALGGLYVETGDVGHALPLLERARKLAPQEAIAHANLGAAYLKAKRTAEAVPELETAVHLEPMNSETQAMLGQALMAEREPARAAKAFAVASSATPSDWGLHYDLALALLSSGATEQAGAALKAIPNNQRTDQVEALAGDIQEKLGDYKQALVDYQTAAHLNPSDANLYTLTAELLRHWTWPEAIEIARYGEKLYPASLRFKLAEGIGLYANSQFPLAAAVFSSLLIADPDNAVYADLLGRSCSLVDDGVSAECEGLEAFSKKHPENAKAATYAAAAILHRPAGQQDANQAEAFLRQALAADPQLAEAHFEMGVLYQARLDWKQSATSLERAIALRPEFPEAHYRLSRAYAHMGRREEAQGEIAMQQKYSQQEKDDLNARMQEVVKFVVKAN
jgi:tetratricopeptide (TPR) repeat protein